ncbi:hypothetical protein ACIGFK_02865 [Streptomyces sp. NPDC085524]|uniref:hypothetical protein n=1 Tax=Streptomyces sp. NPDC085524 TaxID=3365728 RepID=UPI0037D7B56C
MAPTPPSQSWPARSTDIDTVLRDTSGAYTAAFAGRPQRVADLVADYARPLSMSVIGHLLGVPAEDHAAIAEQATVLSGLVWGHLDAPGQLVAAHALD